MRLYADEKSVKRRENSVLSIVETALATLAIVVICVHSGSWLPAAWVCILAPLALLRTPMLEHNIYTFLKWTGQKFVEAVAPFFNRTRKTNQDSRTASSSIREMREKGWPESQIRLIATALTLVSYFLFLPFSIVLCQLATLGVVVLGLTVRYAFGFYTVITHFSQSVVAIPTNFRKITFCIDSNVEPEFIPGQQRLIRETPQLKFMLPSGWFESYRKGRKSRLFVPEVYFNREITFAANVIFEILSWVNFILFFAPALVFRFSVKSSAIVYGPLIWLSMRDLAPDLPHSARVALILDSQNSRRRRMTAFLGIALFTLKIVIWVSYDRFKQDWQSNEYLQFIDWFVVPHTVPPWQLLAVSLAILVYVQYYACDRDRVLHREGIPFSRMADYRTRALSFFITIGTFIVVPIKLYLLIIEAGIFDFITVGDLLSI